MHNGYVLYLFWVDFNGAINPQPFMNKALPSLCIMDMSFTYSGLISIITQPNGKQYCIYYSADEERESIGFKMPKEIS